MCAGCSRLLVLLFVTLPLCLCLLMPYFAYRISPSAIASLPICSMCLMCSLYIGGPRDPWESRLVWKYELGIRFMNREIVGSLLRLNTFSVNSRHNGALYTLCNTRHKTSCERAHICQLFSLSPAPHILQRGLFSKLPHKETSEGSVSLLLSFPGPPLRYTDRLLRLWWCYFFVGYSVFA